MPGASYSNPHATSSLLPEDHAPAPAPAPESSDTQPPVSHASSKPIESTFQDLSVVDKVTVPIPGSEPVDQRPTVKAQVVVKNNTTFQLPPEVMAEIFLTVCHADSDKFLRDKARERRTTPLVLGHVCGQWRDIVWSAPRIWSHVSLNLSSSRYAAQVTLLGEWLGRSGMCPLTINLMFQDPKKWTQTMPIELIQLLASNSYRWQSIDTVLPESWYPILQDVKHNLPLLTTLTTQPLRSDCELSPARRKPLDLFQFAPALNSLHLNGYYLTHVIFPWSQLTMFTLQHVFIDECFYALPKTPNLTYCRIYTILSINGLNRPVEGRPISLLKLQTLIIYAVTWDDTVRLLSNMSFPALRSFELSTPQDDVLLVDLPGLLLHAGTSRITRLALSEFKWLGEERDLFIFFRDMPSLEVVEIEFQSSSFAVSDLVFSDILKGQGSAADTSSSDATEKCLLPYLQSFTFSGPVVPTDADFHGRLLYELQFRRNSQSADTMTTVPNSRKPFTRLAIVPNQDRAGVRI